MSLRLESSKMSKSALTKVFKIRELPVIFALVLLVLVTFLANPLFLTPQSVKDLLLNSTILMILAAGQAIVIITRNVDLSVGAIVGLCGFLTGTLFVTFPDIPILLVFLLGISLGGVLGAINGLLVTTAKVPALVITLGTLYVFRGINNAWAGGKEYFSGDRPQDFGNLSVDTFFGFPIITLVGLVVVLALGLVLSKTRSGRDFYAIGSDPDAAKLLGLDVSKRVFFAFLINGLLAGLVGVLYASRFSSVGATTGTGMELDVVAAVVVGGVAIFGGSGTVFGAAIGAVLLTTITSSLTATGVDKFWQQAVVGVLILGALIIARFASLRRTRKLSIEGARNV